jgi:hypothetical protein
MAEQLEVYLEIRIPANVEHLHAFQCHCHEQYTFKIYSHIWLAVVMVVRLTVASDHCVDSNWRVTNHESKCSNSACRMPIAAFAYGGLAQAEEVKSRV